MPHILTLGVKPSRPRLTLSFIVSITILGLSACVSSGDIRTSATPLNSDMLAAGKTLPDQHGSWPSLDWPTQVGGPALQQLVDEALADNPGLKAAATRLDVAQALADATRASSAPSVGANFSSTLERFTEHGLVPPPLAGAVRSDNQLTVNFSYDFDFWGRHAAELRAVLAQGKVQQAEQYNARLILATAIARNWLQLNRHYQQLDLLQQQRSVRMQFDGLTQRRIAAGLDTQSENLAGKIQLENLNAEQQQWQEAIAVTRNQLAALLGKGPDRGLLIARPVEVPSATAALPDALTLALLGRRPDIVAARWRVEALQGEIATARSLFYPNVNLNAFAGLSSLGLANLFRTGSAIAGIGPVIRLPIFESGGLRAQLKGKVAGYDGAVDTYNQTLIDALREVADQVQMLRGAHEQDRHQLLAAQAAATAVRLSEQRRRVGTGNQLQVLTSQAALLQQRRTELDSRMRIADLRVSLIKALGGGFDAAATALTVPVAAPDTSSRPTISRAAS